MPETLVRKDGKFKAVSSAPSINLTPMGSSKVPIPYPVVADLSNAVAVVESVRFNGNPAVVLDQSSQPSCTGDSGGSDKGVKSGTLNGEVKPSAGSSTVRAGGKQVLRHGDPCTMQGGNTVGTYVAPPSPAPPAATEASKPEEAAPEPAANESADAPAVASEAPGKRAQGPQQERAGSGESRRQR